MALGGLGGDSGGDDAPAGVGFRMRWGPGDLGRRRAVGGEGSRRRFEGVRVGEAVVYL